MKSGITGSLNDPENTYPYWVLPHITLGDEQSKSGWRGTWRQQDSDAVRLQTEQIQSYLSGACEGHWTISNNRFYFQLESDWEMFKTMCVIGWQ